MKRTNRKNRNGMFQKKVMGFAAGAALMGLGGTSAFGLDTTAPGVDIGFENPPNAGAVNTTDPLGTGANASANQFAPGSGSHTASTWSTGATYAGSIRPYTGTATDDWSDVRGGVGVNGGYGGSTASGLITAVPSGFEGTTSLSGSQHGIVMFNSAYGSGAGTAFGGVVGYAGRSYTDPQGTTAGAYNAWDMRVHFNLSSGLKIWGGNPSLNAFNWYATLDNTGGPSGFADGYGSGAPSFGFSPVNAEGTNSPSDPVVAGLTIDNPFTGATATIVNPSLVNQWLTMEIVITPSADGTTFTFDDRLWNADGTVLLWDSGSSPSIAVFGGVLGGAEGPFWFWNGEVGYSSTMTDNAGLPIDDLVSGDAPLPIPAVPEPTSLALLGISGVLLLRRRRAAERA